MSNGACDVNDGGGFATCTFSGTVSAIDSTTGRGVATLQTSVGGDIHQAIYVVSASELILEQIDPASQKSLILASVLQQSGPFSNGSLHGNTLSYARGVDLQGGYDVSSALIGNFDGAGNWNMVEGDENLGGVIAQIPPYHGTYSVAANGAVTRIGNGATTVGFMVSQNKAFLVSQVNIADYFAVMEPQSGGPFSNGSIAGSYVTGSLPPVDYANGINDVTVMLSDGNGNITQNGDSSKPSGLDQWFNYLIPYSMDANGRGTPPGYPSGSHGTFYVISSTKWIGMNAERDARLVVAEH